MLAEPGRTDTAQRVLFIPLFALSGGRFLRIARFFDYSKKSMGTMEKRRDSRILRKSVTSLLGFIPHLFSLTLLAFAHIVLLLHG